MKKLFISQPMRDKTEEEILEVRNQLIEKVKSEYGEVEVIDSYLGDIYSPVENFPLWCLGKSLELLSTADLAVFAPGWESARGCKIEHQCCVDYGIEIF